MMKEDAKEIQGTLEIEICGLNLKRKDHPPAAPKPAAAAAPAAAEPAASAAKPAAAKPAAAKAVAAPAAAKAPPAAVVVAPATLATIFAKKVELVAACGKVRATLRPGVRTTRSDIGSEEERARASTRQNDRYREGGRDGGR